MVSESGQGGGVAETFYKRLPCRFLRGGDAGGQTAMRKIRELYRLKYEAGLSHERIARALVDLSKGVVAKYVKRTPRRRARPGRDERGGLDGRLTIERRVDLSPPAGPAVAGT